MLASTLRCASSITNRRVVVAQLRSLSAGGPKSDKPKSDGPKLPFGLEKIMGEPDNLIATDRERRSKKGYIPDFVPEEVKKDLDELGLDGIDDLDEMEEKNMDGYNELGLVPPEGAGSFSSPILIPSRMDTRTPLPMPCFGSTSRTTITPIISRTWVFFSKCCTFQMKRAMARTKEVNGFAMLMSN